SAGQRRNARLDPCSRGRVDESVRCRWPLLAAAGLLCRYRWQQSDHRLGRGCRGHGHGEDRLFLVHQTRQPAGLPRLYRGGAGVFPDVHVTTGAVSHSGLTCAHGSAARCARAVLPSWLEPPVRLPVRNACTLISLLSSPCWLAAWCSLSATSRAWMLWPCW